MSLAVLWLFQTPLWAGIYKWKDDQGKIHFTDDKSRIPLKYRGQLEKFKGVVDPSARGSGPSADPAAAGPDAEAEAGSEAPAAAVEKPGKGPEKSKYSKEQIALLKKVKTYMTREWAAHVRLVNNIKPTKINGKYYVSSARKSATGKKGIINQIGGSAIPSLVEVKKFLKKSRVNDTKIKMGNLEMMEKVRRIKEIIDAEIPQQKALIDKLKKDLGAEDKPPVNDPDAFIPGKSSGIRHSKPKASSGSVTSDLSKLVD